MTDYVVTKQGKQVAELSDFCCELCECEFSYPSRFLQPSGSLLAFPVRTLCPNCNAEVYGELKFVEATE